jgi:hypothetical protein
VLARFCGHKTVQLSHQNTLSSPPNYSPFFPVVLTALSHLALLGGGSLCEVRAADIVP